MMKLFFLVFLCLINVSAFAQETDFFDTVLDFQQCRNCYFLSIEIQSDVYTGKALIENDDLIEFLRVERKLKTSEYKTFARELLEGKRNLEVGKAQISHGLLLTPDGSKGTIFRLVRQYDDVDRVASLGCVSFVNHYFVNKPVDSNKPDPVDCVQLIDKMDQSLLLSRRTIGLHEDNSIISKLFGWKIAVRLDDISGFLIIDRMPRKLTKSEKNGAGPAFLR